MTVNFLAVTCHKPSRLADLTHPVCVTLLNGPLRLREWFSLQLTIGIGWPTQMTASGAIYISGRMPSLIKPKNRSLSLYFSDQTRWDVVSGSVKREHEFVRAYYRHGNCAQCASNWHYMCRLQCSGTVPEMSPRGRWLGIHISPVAAVYQRQLSVPCLRS